jgi:hypothetical protein
MVPFMIQFMLACLVDLAFVILEMTALVACFRLLAAPPRPVSREELASKTPCLLT